MKTLISLLFLIAFNNVYAANISAQLDVNPVLVNDTFHLTYIASGAVDGEPDFSPVTNDFELLGTRQSTNMSMINGNISRSKKWTLNLLAKKVGTFTIPAISFGSDSAPEVKVIIKNIVASNGASLNQDFALEMTTSQQSGFVQQQFIITVKLFVAKNINNYQFGNLATSNPDTLILPLGKDQQYKTYRGTKQYIVVEKKYAIFPQKAETLKINPFVAVVTMEQSSASSFYDPFNIRTTSKRLYSKNINLSIKDIPSQYTSDNWLPAASLKLEEQWPQNNKFVAGEPITRTIIISAEGLTAAQLPEIKLNSVDGIKQYPDKPELVEKKTATGLLSNRKQKIALIPTKEGSYILPELNIQWWNTETNKIETAHLAQRRFTVLPAVNNGNIPVTPSQQTADASVKGSTLSTASSATNVQANNNSFWFWLSILFIFLWLVTLALWWRSTSGKTDIKAKQNNNEQSIKRCLKNLKSACEKNNAEETKKALLAWAKVIFTESPPLNLTEISRHVDKPLQQSISKLNQHLYSAADSEWTCGDIYYLCKNFKQLQTEKTKKSNSAKLEAFNYK